MPSEASPQAPPTVSPYLPNNFNLNVRATRMQRLPTPRPEKYECAHDSRNEPEQHIDQIDPNRVLHALDIAITFGVLVDEHFAKFAEDCRP